MNDSITIKKIAEEYDLMLIYSFGSRATDTDTPLSDVDIAILVDGLGNRDFKALSLNLIFKFSQLFDSDKIDLLILNKASLAIQFKVISEGKILYQRKLEIRTDFEEKVIKLYLDFKKFEVEYYKVMYNQILKGE